VAKRFDKESVILDPYHKNFNNVQRQSHRVCRHVCLYESLSLTELRVVTTDGSFSSVDEARHIFI
jgi:hypothetical protein